MIEGEDIAVRRLATYATKRNLRLGRCLGSGVHGVVHEAESKAFPGFVAVKAHRNSAPYERERDAYQCLAHAHVREICGLSVPQFIAWNDDLLVVEMTMVQPPFILDFGGAWLDATAPEFPPEVWDDWNRKIDEEFEARANDVRRVLAVLRSYGVVMLDVHPGNIRFRN